MAPGLMSAAHSATAKRTSPRTHDASAPREITSTARSVSYDRQRGGVLGSRAGLAAVCRSRPQALDGVSIVWLFTPIKEPESRRTAAEPGVGAEERSRASFGG